MKPDFSPLDRQWMLRALELAQQAAGLSSPNPTVGCVLVRDGRMVGEGFHDYDQRDHAEIVALRQAGDLARNATAFVTLEPCNHFGRTGPCVDALLAAGLRRVVIATRDPNPVVRGRSVRKLENAGVEVDLGLCEEQARRVNDGFAKYIQTTLPFVEMKIATTLDGRIAPAHAPKPPHQITGAEVMAEVHRRRHSADALLTGIGTALADDPLLTDRSGLPRRRPLLRILLDSTLRLPPDSRLATTANNDLLVFFSHASPAAQQALQARGVRIEQVGMEGTPGRIALNEVLRSLAQMQMIRVFVEAGARVNAAMLNHDLVDKLTLFYGPTFLGPHAVPMLAETTKAHLIRDFSIGKMGENFAFEAYLRDPWEEVRNGRAQGAE